LGYILIFYVIQSNKNNITNWSN